MPFSDKTLMMIDLLADLSLSEIEGLQERVHDRVMDLAISLTLGTPVIAVNTDIITGLKCSICDHVFVIGEQYIVTNANPFTVRCSGAHLNTRHSPV